MNEAAKIPAGYVVGPECVISFPHLFEPKPKSQEPGAKSVYSASFLFDADARKTPEYRRLQTAFVDMAKAKWPKITDPKTLHEYPFRSGDQKDYQGYAGCVYVSSSSDQQPHVVDARMNKILDPKRIYAGCIVIPAFTLYAWTYPKNNPNGKKGISFGLAGVQLVDGAAPRIDGRASVDKLFSPIEGLPEEEDDDHPF